MIRERQDRYSVLSFLNNLELVTLPGPEDLRQAVLIEDKIVRGVGFEPTNPFPSNRSTLRDGISKRSFHLSPTPLTRLPVTGH